MREYIKERSKVRSENKKLYIEILENYEYKCAICGWSAPIGQGGCDLHHIDSWKTSKNNTKENLILLCPNHHKLADAGIITKEELKTYLVLEITLAERVNRKLHRHKTIYNKCFPKLAV